MQHAAMTTKLRLSVRVRLQTTTIQYTEVEMVRLAPTVAETLVAQGARVVVAADLVDLAWVGVVIGSLGASLPRQVPERFIARVTKLTMS